MASTRRTMGKARKERQRDIPDPQMPPAPPKGKRGSAAKTRINRTKQPLRGGKKVKD